MLECVVNLSEGRDGDLLTDLAAAAGPCLLDIHADRDHNRSVLTMAGPLDLLMDGARSLAALTVRRLDLRGHQGVHPRLGVLDVVPWVSMTGPPVRDAPLGPATAARDAFAAWAATSLGLPCFKYGPERSLPEVRRNAWTVLLPDEGPPLPHPTAGAVAVGARPLLVAYNLWLAIPDLALARQLAAEIRGPAVRALGLAVGTGVQVSCNLLQPTSVGPASVFDAIAARTPVARAELVGLAPQGVVERVPPARWPELDLDRSMTIEARLQEAGLAGEVGT